MRQFNVRLAPFIEREFLDKVRVEASKPQSLRAIARKLSLTVYAVKRLIDYSKSIERTNMVNQ